MYTLSRDTSSDRTSITTHRAQKSYCRRSHASLRLRPPCLLKALLDSFRFSFSAPNCHRLPRLTVHFFLVGFTSFRFPLPSQAFLTQPDLSRNRAMQSSHLHPVTMWSVAFVVVVCCCLLPSAHADIFEWQHEEIQPSRTHCTLIPHSTILAMPP